MRLSGCGVWLCLGFWWCFEWGGRSMMGVRGEGGMWCWVYGGRVVDGWVL